MVYYEMKSEECNQLESTFKSMFEFVNIASFLFIYYLFIHLEVSDISISKKTLHGNVGSSVHGISLIGRLKTN